LPSCCSASWSCSALGGVLGSDHLARSGRPAALDHHGQLRRAGGAGGVGLADEHGAGGAVQAHRPVVLDQVDGDPVEQLEHGRPQPTADADHGGASVLRVRKVGDEGRRRVLRRHQPQLDPRNHPQCSLTAYEELEQGQAGDVLDAPTAEGDQPAVG
jgi:hypothetical protein